MNESSSNAGSAGGLNDNGTNAAGAAEADTHVQGAVPATPAVHDTVQDSFGENPAAPAPDLTQELPAAQPEPAAAPVPPTTPAPSYEAAPVAPAAAVYPEQPHAQQHPELVGAGVGAAAGAAGAASGPHLGPGPAPMPNWAQPSDGGVIPPYGAPGQAYVPPAQPGKRSPMKTVIVAAMIAGLLGGGIGAGVTYAVKDNNSSSSSSALSATPSGTNAALKNPGTVAEVAAAVMPSVVDIQVNNADGTGDEGTGIIISADGKIMTNNHVIAAAAAASAGSGSSGSSSGGAATITVTFNDGSTGTAKIVGAEPRADLAVIQVDGKTGLTPAQLADSTQLVVGQPVVAIGSPLGLSGTVTSGIVSSLNRPVETSGETSASGTPVTVVLDAVQTDAAINPGNSGGPLVDMLGRVIGINSAIASNTGSGGGTGSSQAGSIGLGFAIPISEAWPIVQQLAAGQPATIASLGVSQQGNADTTTRTGSGYKVATVTSGGPADKAGLKAGDVITKIGNRLVYSYADVAAAVRSHRPGDQVTVTYTRGGSSQTTTVTLGTLPATTATK